MQLGGYLPFELPYTGEYHTERTCDLQRFNCGRTALYCALKGAAPQKVYIPHYICDCITNPFDLLGIDYEYYYLGQDLLPVGVNLASGEYLLWVNYFGLAGKHAINRVVEQYRNLIIDNTQAFFSQQVPDAYNLYSCRKFFGVSDGAYLIKRGLHKLALPQDISYERLAHKLKYYDLGLLSGYNDFVYWEQNLGNELLAMSNLTQRMLASIDYGYVQTMRKENFTRLHELLKPINLFPIRAVSDTSMAYPLLVKEEGLLPYLNSNNMLIRSCWRHVMDCVLPNTIEYQLSQYLFLLPIDQRYGVGQMEFLAQMILDYMEGKAYDATHL